MNTAPVTLARENKANTYERYRQDANVVISDHDVAKAFPDSRSVNRALRKYLQEHPDDRSGES